MKWLIFSVLLLTALTACGRSRQNQHAVTTSPPDEISAQSEEAIAGSTDDTIVVLSQYWRVTLNDFQTAAALSGKIDVVQYDGSVQSTAVDEAPADGCVFVLLDLTIEKTQGGKARFSWKDTYLRDVGGQVYMRHENDSFLENVGYAPRLKATDQTFGTETGWVCFEVLSDAGALTLVHDGEDGEINIPTGAVK